MHGVPLAERLVEEVTDTIVTHDVVGHCAVNFAAEAVDYGDCLAGDGAVNILVLDVLLPSLRVVSLKPLLLG